MVSNPLVHDRVSLYVTTPWGTFMYANIPFGLMNAGATFQRDMDIAIAGEIGKFVVIYVNPKNTSLSST